MRFVSSAVIPAAIVATGIVFYAALPTSSASWQASQQGRVTINIVIPDEVDEPLIETPTSTPAAPGVTEDESSVTSEDLSVTITEPVKALEQVAEPITDVPVNLPQVDHLVQPELSPAPAQDMETPSNETAETPEMMTVSPVSPAEPTGEAYIEMKDDDNDPESA